MMETTGAPSRSLGRPRKGLQICFQCRNRKVRCDSTAGGCENCRRLKFQCSFAVPDQQVLDSNGTPRTPTSSDSHSIHPRLEKRRVRTACIQCRDKKTKCCGTRPSCRRCSHRGVDCRYPDPSKSSSSSSSSSSSNKAPKASSTSTHRAQSPDRLRSNPERIADYQDRNINRHVSATASPASSLGFELSTNKTIVKQHIDAFFDFVYPIPCYAFVHKATFCQSWAQGTHNPRLLKAMCGLTARYIAPAGDAARLRQATRWIQESEVQLLMRLSEPSMSDIEALMLTTLDHIIARRFSKMLVSACLAARLAFMMRLNYEDGRLSFLTRERRRRLMWAIFTMETLYSSGRAEFTGCSKDTIHLQLPCNERSFTLDMPVMTEPLEPSGTPPPADSTELGLMAYNVRVLDIRDRIQRLSHTITHRQKPLVECIALLKGLVGELESLRRSLPPQFTWDKKNLFLRAYTPQRTPFVMFHTWWHQCQCDMYRFTIPGLREGLPLDELRCLPADLVAYCRAQCLEHALAVADIMATVTEMGRDIFITDPALVMCTFHSARVISRLGSAPQFAHLLPRDVLIAKLRSCSDILEGPAELYPTTRLLQGGILDLIHDAEHDAAGDSSSPLRSGWDTERPESDSDASGSQRSGVVQGSRHGSVPEVYSKYSVTDEIRKLKFHQDGEETAREYQASCQDTGGSGTHAAGVVSQQFTIAGGQDEEGGPQAYVPMPQDITANGFGFSEESSGFGGGGGGTTAPYDVTMTLGFEPSYGECQPDLFLDSFMPLQNDWNMPDPGCF
ncbi:putative transcriptional regulatory protein PB1A11.04c [Colletotrichum tanaceti]|uniref:Putative transcriptional regulatory protein PB1A11.04c n=1 Tax=Colletotrichum tanaceti TaxID=1306861 RepID=A0A4U6X8H5_9PEZI|nr:putative transcriptional regulatory protein PB1A11.04c [Colletotrichum tanaceti]TKW51249.1 putative transcriptional regulatory protein PB1A11.04c [Colletotrichum tanaceti]